MPRKKKQDDGHEANRNARVDPVIIDGRPVSVSGLFGLPPEPASVESAYGAFSEIVSRDDGWLRVVPHEHGRIIYFKWKFSSGEHKGKYVMYVELTGPWSAGIVGLAEKLAKVDDGLLKPAHDTFYDPR